MNAAEHGMLPCDGREERAPIDTSERIQTRDEVRQKRRKGKWPAEQRRARRLEFVQRRKILLMAKFNFACPYCGTSLLKDPSTFVGVSLDHFQPRSAGGKLTDENAVPCCPACNALKGNTPARTIAEARQIVQQRFEPFRRFFVEALARAGEQRHKPTLLGRIMRRLKGGAA